MPWRVTNVCDQRVRFIAAWQSDDWALAALCREFGISRKTGYKWLARYANEGPSGLVDHSHARQRHPNAISEDVQTALLEARRDHPTWGPRKLLQYLAKAQPTVAWPSHSWVSAFFAQHGISVPAKRRLPVSQERLTPSDGANDVWAADLKGWFRCGDGSKCTPLTIQDQASRYLLRCQALAQTDFAHVQPVFESAFREFGLPRVLRTDNGPPFASTGLAGLSELAVWLIKLGIRPERIARGKPQQNGRLERLHRTLKAEAADPPRRTMVSQQRELTRWRREYNEERPHAALDGATPDACYEPSPRSWRRLPAPFHYPEGVWRRVVNRQGCIRWTQSMIYLTEVLAGETVALEELGDRERRYLCVYFQRYPLGIWDERYAVWVPSPTAAKLRRRHAEDNPWHW